MKLHGSAALSQRQRRRLVGLVGSGDDGRGGGRLLAPDRLEVGQPPPTRRGASGSVFAVQYWHRLHPSLRTEVTCAGVISGNEGKVTVKTEELLPAVPALRAYP